MIKLENMGSGHINIRDFISKGEGSVSGTLKLGEDQEGAQQQEAL